MEAVHFVATLAPSEEGKGEKGRQTQGGVGGGLSAGKRARFKALLHIIKSAKRPFKTKDIGAISLQQSDFLEALMLISVRPVKLGEVMFHVSCAYLLIKYQDCAKKIKIKHPKLQDGFQ